MHVPKIISDNAILGQLGVNFVERILLNMGFVLHTTNSLEAGIDGFIELRDRATGAASNFFIAVQIKATQQDFLKETPSTFEWVCTQRDLDYWLQGNAPIVLIIVRPHTEEAYWVPIKEYFRDLSNKAKRRIVFDRVRNRFDAACAPQFSKLAVPRDIGVYRAPVSKAEKLYLNLLPTTPSEWLFVASTEYSDYREVRAAMKADNRHCDSEWLIRRRMLMSFHDLSEEPFKHYCDLGTVERHHRAEWEKGDDLRNELRELLNLALRQKARAYPLLYHSMKEYLYFAATASGRARRLQYRGLRSDTEREVCGPRYSKKDPGRLLYYRHSAMQWQFHFLENKWYLEITPTYHYTRDGLLPDLFAEEHLKRIKEKEKNAAVLGQVVMWADLLARRGDLFSGEYPFLQFGSLESLDLDYGINDDQWLSREDEAERVSAQRDLEFLK